MGKPTGFLEYERENNPSQSPELRIKHFNEFHPPLSRNERQKQGARCMECGIPFCQSGAMINGMVSGCPLHNLIPEWNDLIYTGNFSHALERLLKTNNFPEFTGRVCPALCEAACTCGLHGSPVTVRENELGIIEEAFEHGLIKPKSPKIRTGKRVAVIGSGPSGLAAAEQLNLRGHFVSVFEKDDRPGGLLMYGIPNMKLEKSIVLRRIELMKTAGIEFYTGVDIGVDKNAKELLNNYDAVLLCCGAGNPRDLTLNDRDANGIYFAVDFLKATTKSLLDSGLTDKNYISAKDKNVVIIGGGDTGNDCVGTSIRHGCKNVVQIEMMPKSPETRADNNPWPEWPRICKTDYGQQEAIALFGRDPRIYNTTVKEFLKDEKGAICGIVTVKLDHKTKGGRPIMTQIPGSEEELKCDLLLIAAGFLGPKPYIPEAFGAELDARGNIKTTDFKTSVDKLFSAGDARRGQSLVVHAINEGRLAAREIDKYLMGYTNL